MKYRNSLDIGLVTESRLQPTESNAFSFVERSTSYVGDYVMMLLRFKVHLIPSETRHTNGTSVHHQMLWRVLIFSSSADNFHIKESKLNNCWTIFDFLDYAGWQDYVQSLCRIVMRHGHPAVGNLSLKIWHWFLVISSDWISLLSVMSLVMIIIPRIVKNERVDDFLITQALESLSVSHPDGVFSALVPQVTCAPDNGGCQQECAVEGNETALVSTTTNPSVTEVSVNVSR